MTFLIDYDPQGLHEKLLRIFLSLKKLSTMSKPKYLAAKWSQVQNIHFFWQIEDEPKERHPHWKTTIIADNGANMLLNIWSTQDQTGDNQLCIFCANSAVNCTEFTLFSGRGCPL